MKVKVTQSCLTLCDPMDCIVHGILQARILGGKPFPSPEDLLNPGIEPRSPTLQVDSLPAELPGKPKNSGVGSLSLLEGIFPTQESNWGLLHCRQILYQLLLIFLLFEYNVKNMFAAFFFFFFNFILFLNFT